MDLSNKKKLSGLKLIGSPVVRYSYNQIMVYDSKERAPGCLWTDIHWQQGFARREHVVAFGTLQQAGKADLIIESEVMLDGGIERCLQVPLNVSSGKVCIEGPEEYPIDRFVQLEPGNYLVVASQKMHDGQLQFSLAFQCSEENKSKVLKADSSLNVPETLLETAEEA